MHQHSFLAESGLSYIVVTSAPAASFRHSFFAIVCVARRSMLVVCEVPVLFLNNLYSCPRLPSSGPAYSMGGWNTRAPVAGLSLKGCWEAKLPCVRYQCTCCGVPVAHIEACRGHSAINGTWCGACMQARVTVLARASTTMTPMLCGQKHPAWCLPTRWPARRTRTRARRDRAPRTFLVPINATWHPPTQGGSCMMTCRACAVAVCCHRAFCIPLLQSQQYYGSPSFPSACTGAVGHRLKRTDVSPHGAIHTIHVQDCHCDWG